MIRKKAHGSGQPASFTDSSKPTEQEAGKVVTEGLAGPYLAAGRVIDAAERSSGFGHDIDLFELGMYLKNQTQSVNHGDMRQVEAMLMSQAIGLQTLSARLIERAMANDQIPGFEVNMRMALRAQNQCRATLESLADMKNPSFVYARQANVTTGPQQVNNGTAACSRAWKSETAQNQLSEGTHELLPDARTSGQASRVDTALEALGAIDRSEVPRR